MIKEKKDKAMKEWNVEVNCRLAEALEGIYKEIQKLEVTQIKQNQTRRLYILKDREMPVSYHNTRPISVISLIWKIYDKCLNK